MGVQVMCAGGLPSVSSGIGAGERLLKSPVFFFYFRKVVRLRRPCYACVLCRVLCSERGVLYALYLHNGRIAHTTHRSR
jgi:hypothetical protein